MGNLFLRLGRSFTYPNVDQRVGQYAWNFSHDFKLRTQVSNDFEIGHSFMNKKLNVLNTFYYMKLRAEIYYDSVDFINKNLEPSKRYGFESSINYLPNSSVDITNTFTFAKAKMRDGHYKNKEIPVIIISGHANIEMAIKSLKSGAFEFIQKPFDQERLMNFVNRAVENFKLKNKNIELESKLFNSY